MLVRGGGFADYNDGDGLHCLFGATWVPATLVDAGAHAMRCVSPPRGAPPPDEAVVAVSLLNASVNGQDISASGVPWTYYSTAGEFEGECAERAE